MHDGDRGAYLTFIRQSNEHLFEECLSKQRLDLTEEGPVTRSAESERKRNQESPLRLFF